MHVWLVIAFALTFGATDARGEGLWEGDRFDPRLKVERPVRPRRDWPPPPRWYQPAPEPPREPIRVPAPRRVCWSEIQLGRLVTVCQ